MSIPDFDDVGRRTITALRARQTAHVLCPVVRVQLSDNIREGMLRYAHSRFSLAPGRRVRGSRAGEWLAIRAHVLVIGDVAGISGLPASALDEACAGTRVSRPVLRSEVLRIIRDERVDVMITTGGATFLAGDEFLAAFAAREAPIALLMATRRPDTAILARLRGAGVHVERIGFPIDPADLRERVQEALRAAQPPPIESTFTTEDFPEEESMPNISKTLEESMKIDGAIAAALADWDSGLCLGTPAAAPA
ncbi:hypothetical protein OV079_53275 [Nannocystis pusilla]|uniref:Uncharacterized protein n=1 Tax=Nannocystis pusilla TaxID=889268 RepID=A0A9X3F9B5_9BACT|nr:hypothetical protein [Nannocystis pusilla]MCY1014148.1 hypothetical protein [Nannocystis pusilla]